jgi:alpha-mannosidase
LRIANKHYSASFGLTSGAIVSLRDQRSGKEILKKPGGTLLVRNDSIDAWGPSRHPYGKVIGKFRAPSQKELNAIIGSNVNAQFGPVHIIEEGPLATIVEVISFWNRSVARMRYTFYADSPKIGLQVLVNWSERKHALQLSFPTTLDANTYTTEIPYGSVDRATGNDEEVCGRWTLLSSGNKKLGFGLVNDGPGGIDIQDGELRQTLVRSPIFCTGNGGGVNYTPDRFDEHMDLGEHIYQFRFCFGALSGVREALPAMADNLMMPPMAYVHIPQGPAQNEGLASGKSAVEVKGKGVRLTALKQSEDGKAMVVRLCEFLGKAGNATLHVREMRKPVPVCMGKFEIKTFRIEKTGKEFRCTECGLLE